MSQMERQQDVDLEKSPSVRYLAEQRVPLRVCCGQFACQILEPLRQGGHALAAAIESVDTMAKPLNGPVILVLEARDLHGAERHALLDLARAALPARPIVIGGSDDRQVLLEVINEWRAFRLLPRASPIEAIVDAIQQAHEALKLELAVGRCAHELLVKCRRLAATVEELQATQERLLFAERLATVGRTIGALMDRMREQATRLEAFRSALSDEVHSRSISTEASTRVGTLLQCLGEAQRCFSALVDDMLALSEARQAELQLAPEELDPFIEQTVRLFRYDPLGQERQISVDCNSKVVVRADRDRLRHALLNLLRNAAQATTPAHYIRVRARKRRGMALIEIEDTGEGMTPETLERLFTPFFTTKGTNGMGLGLHLTRATVDAHGGTLDCTSILGHGTTFRVHLPISRGSP